MICDPTLKKPPALNWLPAISPVLAGAIRSVAPPAPAPVSRGVVSRTATGPLSPMFHHSWPITPLPYGWNWLAMIVPPLPMMPPAATSPASTDAASSTRPSSLSTTARFAPLRSLRPMANLGKVGEIEPS